MYSIMLSSRISKRKHGCLECKSKKFGELVKGRAIRGREETGIFSRFSGYSNRENSGPRIMQAKEHVLEKLVCFIQTAQTYPQKFKRSPNSVNSTSYIALVRRLSYTGRMSGI